MLQGVVKEELSNTGHQTGSTKDLDQWECTKCMMFFYAKEGGQCPKCGAGCHG